MRGMQTATDYRAVSGSSIESIAEGDRSYTPAAGNYLNNVIDITERIATGISMTAKKGGIEEMLEAFGWKDTDKNRQRLEEVTGLDPLLCEREELGLNVDYYTRTDKSGGERVDFRYRKRQKEGVMGCWTSRKYVLEAVNALKRYDSLIKSEKWSDLKEAYSIAMKYFTDEAVEEVRKLFVEKTQPMVGPARSGTLDASSAKSLFSYLIVSKEPQNITIAYDIAKNYLPEAVVKETNNYLLKHSFRTFAGRNRQDSPYIAGQERRWAVLEPGPLLKRQNSMVPEPEPVRQVMLPPVPREVALRDYNGLIVSDDPVDVVRAVKIAKNYLPDRVDASVNMVRELLRQQRLNRRLSCEDDEIIELSSEDLELVDDERDSGVYMQEKQPDGTVVRKLVPLHLLPRSGVMIGVPVANKKAAEKKPAMVLRPILPCYGANAAGVA
ncbi:hypothetical protein KY359_06555 [Candidatus Woesearchaeota archaeon]|nr:hypothetical protein [Candidatus Woesearchaeota archaeon]